jgi:hypothetical protein
MPPKKHNTLRVAKTGRVEVVQGTPSGPSQGADTPNKTKNKSKSKKKPKRAAVVEIDSPIYVTRSQMTQKEILTLRSVKVR